MRNNKNKGFTLIELLIVVAIIGILAAVLIPNLLNARAAANDSAGSAVARNISTAVAAVAIREDTTPDQVTCVVAGDVVNITLAAAVEETVSAPGPVNAADGDDLCAGNTATSIVVSVPYSGGTSSPATVNVSF